MTQKVPETSDKKKKRKKDKKSKEKYKMPQSPDVLFVNNIS